MLNPKRHSDITGVILAGGKSSRMGQDKALLDYEGRPFIQHVAEALKKIIERVIVISDHGEDYKFFKLSVHEDIYKNCGPLSGIHAAFARTNTEKIFLASCDLPMLSSHIIQLLVQYPLFGDVVVISWDGRIQPLCGIYSRRCMRVLTQHLKHGQHSVVRFIENLSTVIVPEDVIRSTCQDGLSNINTRQEYNAFLESMRKKKKERVHWRIL